MAIKNKFTIEKDYNISIVAEGLDVNQAEVEFCLLLKDFKLSLPLKNIKENVFRLRLPSKIKDTIKGLKDINYSINVRDDNLVFEVAKSKFELELFALKEVSISEATDDTDIEQIIIEHNSVKIEEEIEGTPKIVPKVISKSTKKIVETKESIVKQLIEEIANKNNKLS